MGARTCCSGLPYLVRGAIDTLKCRVTQDSVPFSVRFASRWSLTRHLPLHVLAGCRSLARASNALPHASQTNVARGRWATSARPDSDASVIRCLPSQFQRHCDGLPNLREC